MPVDTPPSSSTPLAGLRVLVVDDTPDMRWLLETMLTTFGADVVTAASAREALGVFSADRVDVLVSDIQMPGATGYDLVGEVRRRGPGGGGEVPALALTAFGGLYNRGRSLQAGFQEQLDKGAPPEEIVAAVARLAGR
jgi:CheY-like chemotaxis protein